MTVFDVNIALLCLVYHVRECLSGSAMTAEGLGGVGQNNALGFRPETG